MGGVSQSTGGAILVGIYPAFWKVDKSRRCLEYNSIENADFVFDLGFQNERRKAKSRTSAVN